LKGLNALQRRYISIKELAEEACKVEIDLIGKPIGKQDQYATAFGGIIQLEIDRLGNVTVIPLNLDHEIIYELENRLLMFYTNMDRDANDILAEQSQKAQVDEKITTESMHRIKAIGYEVKESLIKGEVDNFGKLLNEHWLEKKKISQKMSNQQINDWYDLAMKNGALGGKIMGAGGGGFFVFCVGIDKRKHLRKTLELAGLKYMDFRFDFEGAKVLANI
jgi:D-glycero-alpha-D-manno-heptose-7-phosphate kinase